MESPHRFVREDAGRPAASPALAVQVEQAFQQRQGLGGGGRERVHDAATLDAPAVIAEILPHTRG